MTSAQKKNGIFTARHLKGPIRNLFRHPQASVPADAFFITRPLQKNEPYPDTSVMTQPYPTGTSDIKQNIRRPTARSGDNYP